MILCVYRWPEGADRDSFDNAESLLEWDHSEVETLEAKILAGEWSGDAFACEVLSTYAHTYTSRERALLVKDLLEACFEECAIVEVVKG